MTVRADCLALIFNPSKVDSDSFVCIEVEKLGKHKERLASCKGNKVMATTLSLSTSSLAEVETVAPGSDQPEDLDTYALSSFSKHRVPLDARDIVCYSWRSIRSIKNDKNFVLVFAGHPKRKGKLLVHCLEYESCAIACSVVTTLREQCVRSCNQRQQQQQQQQLLQQRRQQHQQERWACRRRPHMIGGSMSSLSSA